MAVKLSIEAKDLIIKLLDKNQKSRLKIAQIKAHKFFEGYDFISLYNMKIIPPFIPDIKGEDDYKYIDPTLDKEKAEDSQVNQFSPLMVKGNSNF